MSACHPTRGCVESNFTLAQDSPLPKWFASSGVPRDQATVTMDYHGGVAGRTATFILRDGSGRRVARVVGELRGSMPLTLEHYGESGPIPYPAYEVVTVDGVIEVIEHRRMEPIFYINTDAEVRRRLGVQ
jgi:hypothetical protein